MFAPTTLPLRFPNHRPIFRATSFFFTCSWDFVCCVLDRQINGTVAYAAQRAWIQNATLRDNILFGSPYDADRYARVLSACALSSDLDLLEAGDQTEIGEKG